MTSPTHYYISMNTTARKPKENIDNYSVISLFFP